MRLAEIRELRPWLTGSVPRGDFTGIACDSRLIKPGAIFVVLAGSRDHGRHHIAAAVAQGAAAILSQEPIAGLRVPLIQVHNAPAALAVISSALQGWPARELAVYGITGTNGKTTCAWLTRDFLQAAGNTVGLLTTVQVEYGARVLPARHTTPDSCELQALLAKMRAAGCRQVVMEVSSHALTQQRVGAMPFAAVAFTNLSQDHLDYHGDFAAYFQAKKQLFAQAAAERPGTPALCCLDGSYGARMATYLAALPLQVLTYGCTPDAQLRAEELELTATGSCFTLCTPEGARHRITTGLTGRYNVSNLLCAMGLALTAGVPPAVLVASAARAEARWGRLERVPLATDYAVFIDYAHTEDALRNVLSTLREIAPGRLSVVFGCGGDRDRSKRPLMGAVCAELADYLVITSDNPRSEAPQAIIDEIVAGVPATTAYRVAVDRRSAIHHVLAQARPGEVILVAGKGHERFQEVQGRYLAFNDREVVLELVKELTGAV